MLKPNKQNKPWKKTINELDPKIQSLPDDALIDIDGSILTGEQIKEIWSNLEFKITDDNYGQERGGANHGNVVEINFQTVLNYSAWGAEGLSYLLLHEIGHSTPQGWQSTQDTWRDYRQSGGDVNYFHESQQFSDNERVANDIAKSIAAALGVTIIENPSHGYSNGSPNGGNPGPGGGGGSNDGGWERFEVMR